MGPRMIQKRNYDFSTAKITTTEREVGADWHAVIVAAKAVHFTLSIDIPSDRNDPKRINA